MKAIDGASLTVCLEADDAERGLAEPTFLEAVAGRVLVTTDIDDEEAV